MALQSSNIFLAGDAYSAIRVAAQAYRAQAQNALATMQQGTVNTTFVFSMLDQLAGVIAAFTAWEATAGLNTYATGQGYPTTMTTDCAAVITAAQATIAWVVTNFPTSGGFLQAYSLNANGTRTPATFTTTQTQGLQTALANFIATMS
jgi:hypothetical protein